MKSVFLPLTLFSTMACLAGCQDSVPKCSDDATIELVKTILSDMLGRAGDETEAEMKSQMVIEYARASAFDEAIQKYTCEGKLVAGGTYQLPITYESQIGDDGQHIVFVGGISPGDSLQLRVGIYNKIKESRKQAIKSQTEANTIAAARPKPTPQEQTIRSESQSLAPSAPKLDTQLVNEPAPMEVPSAVRKFMEQTYGQYDATHSCWTTDHESQGYCMTVARMDRVKADTGERLYLLATGQAIDEGGEPDSSGFLSGIAGAFVFELKDSGTELVASNLAQYIGSRGSAPDQWKLVKLARSDYYGWQATWGDCHQGYCGSRLAILAPFGKNIKDIADFTVDYSNDGACGSQDCLDGKSTIETTVAFETASTDSDIYALLLTFNGMLNGENQDGTEYRLEFDRKEWRYVVPGDWPLADVDY